MPSFENIPVKARALTALGDETARAVVRLFAGSQGSLFPAEATDDYSELAAALQRNRWMDDQAAQLIDACAKEIEAGRGIDLRSLTRWAIAHPNDADGVVECLALNVPVEVEILRRLSRQGSQKRVFLAIWRLRQQEVVLKQVVGPAEAAATIVARELQAYPLNLSHPNIIETYAIHNAAGEVFLIERLVPEVLSDVSPFKGVHETANLLYDITKAIKFLHDNGLVHGDIKPDNIGHRGHDYVLLDFGICRPKESFTPTVTPTGSIRTRAPELLSQPAEYHEPDKVDIWALGATIFNIVARRFPLIDQVESIPRVSSPIERSAFEREVTRRMETEWSKWVTLDAVPEVLRSILGAMLEKDVAQRIASGELLARIERELPAFLRTRETHGAAVARFSPLDTLPCRIHQNTVDV